MFLESCRDWSVWIDTIETPDRIYCLNLESSLSGLICLDWYDWNVTNWSTALTIGPCRDWSVWIDTIETSPFKYFSTFGLLGSGLICLDWYDWNPWMSSPNISAPTASGLICLDWYDWNDICDGSAKSYSLRSGLICLNWYDWNSNCAWLSSPQPMVGIDLSGLIRLKHTN